MGVNVTKQITDLRLCPHPNIKIAVVANLTLSPSRDKLAAAL
jgi:hypothetical protein